MKQVTFKGLGMKMILFFSVATLEMEDSGTTPSRFGGRGMNSNLKFYKPSLNKYEGTIKTFSDRASNFTSPISFTRKLLEAVFHQIKQVNPERGRKAWDLRIRASNTGERQRKFPA